MKEFSPKMQEEAYAKINLHLHVVGKRPDGYHLLDSIVVFPDVGDMLTVKAADATRTDLVKLEITGPFSAPLQKEDLKHNLITKAAHQLATTTDKTLPSVILTLEKNLPVSSGIGGGSTDAAATLRLLMRYWGLKPSEEELSAIALKLGADVTVCLHPSSQRMEGIGEVLTPLLGLPDFGMILVNHGEAVSTADIFKNRQANFSKRAQLVDKIEDFDVFIEQLSQLTNDLQPPACKLNPTIVNVLEAIESLPNCRLSRMSGSGATCFGLFETPQQAKEAAKILSLQQAWWIWGGKGNLNS